MRSLHKARFKLNFTTSVLARLVGRGPRGPLSELYTWESLVKLHRVIPALAMSYQVVSTWVTTGHGLCGASIHILSDNLASQRLFSCPLVLSDEDKIDDNGRHFKGGGMELAGMREFVPPAFAVRRLVVQTRACLPTVAVFCTHVSILPAS
jgi:hypothetical protein